MFTKILITLLLSCSSNPLIDICMQSIIWCHCVLSIVNKRDCPEGKTDLIRGWFVRSSSLARPAASPAQTDISCNSVNQDQRHDRRIHKTVIFKDYFIVCDITIVLVQILAFERARKVSAAAESSPKNPVTAENSDKLKKFTIRS